MWWAERYGFLVFIAGDDFCIYSKTKQQTVVQRIRPWEEMGLHRYDCLATDALDEFGCLVAGNEELYDIYKGVLGQEALDKLIEIVNEPEEIKF